jgi:hypothetical protein
MEVHVINLITNRNYYLCVDQQYDHEGSNRKDFNYFLVVTWQVNENKSTKRLAPLARRIFLETVSVVVVFEQLMPT